MVGLGSEDKSKLEELGSHVAQMRERISELDRAVTAIGNKCKLDFVQLSLIAPTLPLSLSLSLSLLSFCFSPFLTPPLSLCPPTHLSLSRISPRYSVSSSSREGPQPVEEPESANYVNMDSFDVLQGMLSQIQQEHERLMGTAAHLSHELEVNTDHVKVKGIASACHD